MPVPAVIEIGAAGDGYFAVSERAHGELLDGLDGAGMRAVLPGLLAALDALRDIDVSGTEGYGIWAPDGTGPAVSWAQALCSRRLTEASVLRAVQLLAWLSVSRPAYPLSWWAQLGSNQ